MTDLVKKFLDWPFCWPPHVTTSVPVPQLLALTSQGAGGGQYMSADEILAIANEKRKEAGLAPIRKRRRTFSPEERRRYGIDGR